MVTRMQVSRGASNADRKKVSKSSRRDSRKSDRKPPRKTHSIEIEFSDENVTSFGGMVLEEQLASRLGLWNALEKRLPEREGVYSWIEIIRAGVGGLLTQARGTYATQEVREDRALLDLLGLEGAPEEATFWRALEGLGKMADSGLLGEVQMEWTRRILAVLKRPELLECHGFFPLFGDGSLLEGSRRREGTTYIRDKGEGLMWATVFAGPFIAAQALARPGEGEQTLIRRMLPGVVEKALEPLRLKERALFLADSLHGDGPTLDAVEGLGLRYVVGAGKLSETERLLREQPASQWLDLGPDAGRRWSESALCLCWIQCAEWKQKRLLVGRRVVREGEMFPTYYGAMTNLREEDLGASDGFEFARKVWRLYDAKGRMELSYQDLLADLDLHHPPCQQHIRNNGFYALATLAHTLRAAVKLLGARSDKENRQRERDKEKRDGVPERIRVKARRGMRLWRLARRLFAIPARVSWHARRLKVVFLGASAHVREQFERWRLCISRC